MTKSRPEPLTDAEVKAILAAAQTAKRVGKRDYLFLRLLAKTGCRVGEILRIRPKDVDFDAGIVYIYKAKRGKRRETMIDGLTIMLLRFWIEEPALRHATASGTTPR